MTPFASVSTRTIEFEMATTDSDVKAPRGRYCEKKVTGSRLGTHTGTYPKRRGQKEEGKN